MSFHAQDPLQYRPLHSLDLASKRLLDIARPIMLRTLNSPQKPDRGGTEKAELQTLNELLRKVHGLARSARSLKLDLSGQSVCLALTQLLESWREMKNLQSLDIFTADGEEHHEPFPEDLVDALAAAPLEEVGLLQGVSLEPAWGFTSKQLGRLTSLKTIVWSMASSHRVGAPFLPLCIAASTTN